MFVERRTGKSKKNASTASLLACLRLASTSGMLRPLLQFLWTVLVAALLLTGSNGRLDSDMMSLNDFNGTCIITKVWSSYNRILQLLLGHNLCYYFPL
jgi:hypothetical protein